MALAAPAAAQNRPVRSDQQVLIQLEKDWDAAFRAKDIPFLENILADEFVATYGDGSLGNKAREIELAKEFNKQVDSSTQDEFLGEDLRRHGRRLVPADADRAEQGETARSRLPVRGRVRAAIRPLAVRVEPEHEGRAGRMNASGMPPRDALRAWHVAVLYTALTVLLAYPLVRHPAGHVLTISPDTDLFLWTLSWDAHAIVHQPFSIFDANIFAPLHRTLAYSEHLIGSGILAAPILGLTHNPVLAMNLVSLLSCVLCGLGTFQLARRAGVGIGRRSAGRSDLRVCSSPVPSSRPALSHDDPMGAFQPRVSARLPRRRREA